MIKGKKRYDGFLKIRETHLTKEKKKKLLPIKEEEETNINV